MPTRLPDIRSQLAGQVWMAGGVAILVALWIVGGTAGWARGMIVTPAAAVEPILGDSRGVYMRAMASTVSAAARGLLIGSVLAFVAAIVATGFPPLRRSIGRLAAIANAAPWVAVAPCLLVILGRERGPVAVAALAVFFFVFVSTTVGLGAAPEAARNVAAALGASRRRRVWSVQLPAAWPSVLDGLKLATPAALAGAVFGEWYGAPRGLGVLLITAMQTGRPERLWASSLLVAACGFLAFALLGRLRWLVALRFGGTIAQASTAPARRHRLLDGAVELATVAGLAAAAVALWWGWIELARISPLVVPRPSAVWTDLVSTPGDYAAAAAATVATAATALAIGTAVGLCAAFAASRSRLLAGITVPVMVLLSATPLVALFPLIARVLGYQPNTVRVLAAVMVFYPIFIYTRSGLTDTHRPALDVADALGGSTARRFRLVIVPGAVPHMSSGFRIACGSAVIAAVVGESLIGRQGLGVEFSYAYALLDLPRAFGAALVIVAVSVTAFALAGTLERAIHARWT